MRTVGRDAELDRIDAFLELAPEAARVLIVEGEAGIGKTTLWLSGVERARERAFRVLVGRPAEAERELSFATLGDLLSSAHEQVQALPPPQRRPLASALLLEDHRGAPIEPRAVAVALVTILRAMAREQPVLVAVDDVQWADAASASALSFALRRTLDEPVAILLARRAGAREDPRMELDPGTSFEQVVVGPLSLGATRQLLEDRLDARFPRPVLRRIHERSGGNPFFALELARALEARGGSLSPQDELPVPSDLGRLLAQRLGVLPPELTEPLAAVAALGEPTFDLIDAGILEPAFEAGVVVSDGDQIRFEHPLLAAAAYERLEPDRRRELHRRLAGLVDDSEERARHLALGAEGPDRELAAVLDDAAFRARLRGAPEAAADLADWALRLSEDDAETVARRTIVAAECRIIAGDRREARALLDTALSEGPTGLARSRLLLHRTRVGDEDADRTIAQLQEALVSAGGDPALEAEILAELTSVITSTRRISDAQSYARRCVGLAERVGDPVPLARALFALARNEFWLGRGFRTELMQRALELDPLCESMSISARPTSQFGGLCLWAGELDMARTLLERAWQMGYDRGDSSMYGLLWYTATLEWLDDRWARSLELANELCDLGLEAEFEPHIAYGLGGRATVLAGLGEEEQTRRAIAEAANHAGGETFISVYLAAFALGLLELSLDRPRQALEQTRPAMGEARAKGIEEPAQYIWFPIYAEAAIACGELEEAEQLLDWVEERAVRLDRPWAIACVGRCRGLLAAARGDEAGAVAASERALREHARVQGRRFDLARTLLAQGETLRRFKKKRVARESIDAATAIFDELGAKLWSAKARRELARVSGRTRATGLTETERRVAELVAAGRSNKEIASELFVSVRTVETHLTHAYAKLGVHSRTELVSRLAT